MIIFSAGSKVIPWFGRGKEWFVFDWFFSLTVLWGETRRFVIRGIAVVGNREHLSQYYSAEKLAGIIRGDS